jgi:hypothetical protein
MAKKARRVPEEARTQAYENVLKRLVLHQPTILSRLLPQLVCELLDPLPIEVLLPPRLPCAFAARAGHSAR